MARRLPAKESMVKLIVGAGQASPSPPVGPALGSKGVKSIDFCKEFNALTAHITPGTPIPSLITVRPDRSFHFVLRTPPTATLLLKAAGVPPSKGGKLRGANAPGRAPALASTPTLVQSLAPDAPGPAAITPQTRPGKSQSASATGGRSIGAGETVEVARMAGGDKPAGSGGGSAQVGEVSLKHVFEIARIKGTEERLKGLGMEGLVRSVVAQARGIGVGIVP